MSSEAANLVRTAESDQAGFGLVTGAALRERICVSEPYFALREPRQVKPGQLVCGVPVEQRPTRERAPITVAEAGRHLAILGLCAAASVAPDGARRYYLAREARIKWLHSLPLGADDQLVGHASGHFLTGRKAAAHTFLATEAGTPVTRFDLEYDVLSEPAFRRLFAHAYLPGTTRGLPDANPYAKSLPLSEIQGDGTRMSARVAAGVEDCAGHFADFPTLPVAVLGAALVELASGLIDQVTGRPGTRWVPVEGRLTAQRLVGAGQSVSLLAVPRQRVRNQLTIQATAAVAAGPAADLLMRFALVD